MKIPLFFFLKYKVPMQGSRKKILKSWEISFHKVLWRILSFQHWEYNFPNCLSLPNLYFYNKYTAHFTLDPVSFCEPFNQASIKYVENHLRFNDPCHKILVWLSHENFKIDHPLWKAASTHLRWRIHPIIRFKASLQRIP